jgi:hypothetical protein
MYIRCIYPAIHEGFGRVQWRARAQCGPLCWVVAVSGFRPRKFGDDCSQLPLCSTAPSASHRPSPFTLVTMFISYGHVARVNEGWAPLHHAIMMNQLQTTKLASDPAKGSRPHLRWCCWTHPLTQSCKDASSLLPLYDALHAVCGSSEGAALPPPPPGDTGRCR